MFPLNSEMAYIKENGKRSTLGEMLDQEAGDISELETRMTTAEGDIDSLETRMTTAEGDIDSLESRMTTAEGDIDSLQDNVSDLQDVISDAYDSEASYAVGDYFIYGDTIYEVITACTGITPPNAEYYTAHSVTDLISTLNSNLTIVENIFESNAGAHNCIYRGKSLGTSVSASQNSAISNSTFDDMYIGDYWTIDGIVYRIAEFNRWLNTGDISCTKPHVVIVPDTNLDIQKMNTTNTASGGYAGSEMYTTNMTTAKSTVEAAFGSAHILSHREYLTNAITNGYASAGAWYDSTIELMNEVMVYGCSFYTPHNSLGATIPNTPTVDKSQLPLFRYDHSRIGKRAGWWMRDVVSASTFAIVTDNGTCGSGDASVSLGVRPCFGIIGS